MFYARFELSSNVAFVLLFLLSVAPLIPKLIKKPTVDRFHGEMCKVKT